MAWKKMFSSDPENKENEVANPEKKIESNTPPEKSIADQIADALKPVTEGFGSMRAEIDALKVRTTPKETHEVTSVMDNEDEAFNQRLTPIMAKTLEMEARLAKDDIEKEYKQLGFGDLWDENRKGIDDFLANSALVTQDSAGKPVPLRGNPEFIRNVADMIIGRAVRKGGVKFDGKDKKFFLEDTNGEGTVITKRVAETEGITKKQLEAAKRFGIPIKEYRAAREKLNFVQ